LLSNPSYSSGARTTPGSAPVSQENAPVSDEVLTAPTALPQRSDEKARVVVSCMEPAYFSEDTRFISESDSARTGFMMSVILDKVIVESIIVSRTAPDTTAVPWMGSFVNVVGLQNSGPRVASCSAGTDLFYAVPTREVLQSLVEDEPAIRAKLLMA
jgi:CRP/FNR family transcriptional regulator, cyclic AMP receptor protein